MITFLTMSIRIRSALGVLLEPMVAKNGHTESVAEAKSTDVLVSMYV